MWKMFILFYFLVFVVSCASSGDIDEIKGILKENRNNISQIKNRIDLANMEIDKDRKKLEYLDGNDQELSSQANELKYDIEKNRILVDSLSSKLEVIETNTKDNKREIDEIKSHYNAAKGAFDDALDKNNVIKIDTMKGIQEIENKYESERRMHENGGNDSE